MNRPTRLVAVSAVLALGLAACSSSGDGGGGGSEGGTAAAYLPEPTTLDPNLASQVTEAEVLQRLFDPLIHYNAETTDIELTGAATDYEVAEDGKSITFTLREGATFHNGEPVNAAAFVRSLNRIAAKETASPVAYHLDGLSGFDEMQAGTATEMAGVRQGENELELVLEFDEPTPEFVIRTGHLVFSPIPEAAEEDFAAFSEQPIGNGPYMMSGPWQHNQGISVVRYEDYNGPLAGNLDAIDWKIYSELQGGYLDFQGGALDTTTVPPESLQEAESSYPDGFVQVQTTILDFLSWHGVEDVNLRRAVSMAIDRDAINEAVFAGTRISADAFIPPANTGYREGSCTYCVHDPEAAMEEFEQADVPEGFTLTMTFNSGAGHEDWVQAAAEQVEETLPIKVKVTPGSENFGDYLKSISGITGVYRYGWGQDYPTPDNWISPFYQTGAGDNYGEYSNPAVDALIDEARTTLDETERLRLYAEAEDIINDEMPGMPMWFRTTTIVYNPDKFSTFPIDTQLGIPHWEGVQAA